MPYLRRYLLSMSYHNQVCVSPWGSFISKLRGTFRKYSRSFASCWIRMRQTTTVFQRFRSFLSPTRSRSKVEGSRTNGRIGNIPSNLEASLAISQNTLIPVSHVLENLMKMLKFSSFAKVGKCQILAKYEK